MHLVSRGIIQTRIMKKVTQKEMTETTMGKHEGKMRKEMKMTMMRVMMM